MPSCGRNAGGHRCKIALEIRGDRVYEPYGPDTPFSPDTTRWRRAAIVESRKLGFDL
jgi:hypothetical protein